MLEVIRCWFNGSMDYYPGVALAAQFYENKALLLVLQKSDNNRNRQRLKEIMEHEFTRLSELQPKNNKEVELPEKKERCESKTKEKPAQSFEGSPVYKSALSEADKAYRQVMAKRTELFLQTRVLEYEDPNTPDKVKIRAQMAIEVVEGYRKASRLYEKANFVQKHGRLPDAEQTDENELEFLPDFRVQQVLNNARKALSKLKKKPLTTERVALMEVHQNRIKTLEKRWAMLN